MCRFVNCGLCRVQWNNRSLVTVVAQALATVVRKGGLSDHGVCECLVQTAVAENIDTDKVFLKIAAIQKVFVLMQ